jgi:hypothetical protein
MRLDLPCMRSGNRLPSPRPIFRLIRGSRRLRRGRWTYLHTITELSLEIELRELWIAIHEAAGASDRAEHLAIERRLLRNEMIRLDDFHLGKELSPREVEL